MKRETNGSHKQRWSMAWWPLFHKPQTWWTQIWRPLILWVLRLEFELWDPKCMGRRGNRQSGERKKDKWQEVGGQDREENLRRGGDRDCNRVRDGWLVYHSTQSPQNTPFSHRSIYMLFCRPWDPLSNLLHCFITHFKSTDHHIRWMRKGYSSFSLLKAFLILPSFLFKAPN